MALGAAHFHPRPALVDAATGGSAPWAHLEFPLSHLFLTPLAGWADLITCNNLRQHIALLMFFLFLYGPWRFFVLGHGRREWFAAREVFKSFFIYFALVALFLSGVIFFPRTPARLVLDDPSLVAVDFHSHSSISWDGLKSFTPEKNASWHEAAGFDASFITDHNIWDQSKDPRPSKSHLSLRGEELSLFQSHIVLLGPRSAVDPALYGGGVDGVRRLLGEAKRQGWVTIMSLPEYWKYPWGEALAEMPSWGLSGFEIVNATPKGLEFPESERGRVLELCRRFNVFAAGATDIHGYGRAACVWNLMRLPGWRAASADERRRMLLDALSRGGYGAVRVVRRNRPAEASGWAIWLDAPRALWAMFCAFTGVQKIITFVWLWLWPLLGLIII